MNPQSLHLTMPSTPIDIIEVFVDSFIGAANNSKLTHRPLPNRARIRYRVWA